jgi:outer membrane protein
MMKSTPLFVTLFLMIATVAKSQQRSLDECIRLALSNNEQVKNGQLDVTSSSYQIKEAKSALLPQVNLSGQYLYYMDIPSQYAPASAFGGPEGEYSKLTLNLAQTTSANIQSSINLFNQSVFTGLQAARTVQTTSNLQLSLTKENLIYNVTATYYTIQILQDNLKRLNENIDNLERTVKINESLKNNELVSANVHNRLLVNLENLKNQYEAQRLSLDKNETLLKYLMNVDIHENISVAAFDYTEVLEEPVKADIQNRPDIKLQKAQIELSKLDKKNVIAGYYPVLSAGMQYGVTGYYNEFSPGSQINNDWIKSSAFSLSLKIPLFDGFQKQFKAKQKEVIIQKNINTLSMMKANAEKEVSDAIENYVSNSNQVTSNKRSLDLAEALFTTSQSEFENGLTSTTELLNAQNDLSSARTNYSNALLNLKLAELSWRKASGTLLTDYTTEN